ncbi:hypothetical protein WJX74_006431 [Apatococcus lobatus]|uniref:Hint domain-containing protein n=1 Tax=Apatococcus lobatus TaxID=904363 RepID=A0AAW1SE40_9CHLO
MKYATFAVSGSDLALGSQDTASCGYSRYHLTVSGEFAYYESGSLSYSVQPDNGQLVFTVRTNGIAVCTGYYQVSSGSLWGISSSSVTTSSTSSSGSSGSCFPGVASVHTRQGSVAMADLNVGDEVLVALPGREPHYEAVFMFSHQDKHFVNPFRTLETDAGHTLMLTPGHYLWASGSDATDRFALVRAADVRVGQWVWASSGTGSAAVAPTRVTRVSTASAQGLFNPHTASGSIMVDGVVAATFTETISASLALHTVVTFPAQLLYRLAPTQALAAQLNTALLKTYHQSVQAIHAIMAPQLTMQ